MAVGTKQVSENEVQVVSGKAGRISPPPEGGLYVRDVEAARAHALAERVQAFKDAGEDVPEGLAALAAESEVSDEDEVINLVDGYGTRDRLFHAEDGPTPVSMREDEAQNVTVLASNHG